MRHLTRIYDFHENRKIPRKPSRQADLTRLPWSKERSLAVDLQIALNDRIAEIRKTGRAL